jgi:hypothetical protein
MTTRTLTHADSTEHGGTRLPDAWGALVIVAISLALWAVIGAAVVIAWLAVWP